MEIPIPEYFSLYNRKEDAAAYQAQAETGGRASDCVQCGQCQEHCPQHLPIIDLLQRVAAKFETE